MPIDRLTFSTSQENVNRIGLRSWKKFGARYTLEPGEDKSEARKALKDFVYESLKKQPDELPEETIKTKEPDTPQSTEAKTIAGIFSCKNMKDLSDFKFLAENQQKKFPEIWGAYLMMEKKLNQ